MFGFNTNIGNTGVSGNLSIGGFSIGGNQTQKEASYEVKLREQYESKVSGYETKLKESQATVNDLSIRLRTSETKMKENWDIYLKTKNDLEINIERIRKERDDKKGEAARLREDMSKFESERQGYLKQISDKDLIISQQAESLKRFEREHNEKGERMKKLEIDLLNKQKELINEEKDDLTSEETIKKQKEQITEMTSQIQRFLDENVQEQIQFRNYENQVRQQEEQIALLTKQAETMQTTITTSTTVEVTDIVTSEVYLEVEVKYNEAINERNAIQDQLDIKNSLIRDLEARIKNNLEKMSILFRTINELKGQIDSYEARELEFKKTIDDYILRLDVFSKDISTKTTKITTYESIIKTKDVKINQLTDTIKARDISINTNKDETKNLQNQVVSLQKVVEEKLKEIVAWTKENEKDDSQIAQLQQVITHQAEIIKNWEAENDRDDAQIVELQTHIKNQEEKINKLKEIIHQIKLKFGFIKENSENFKIVDDTMEGECHNSFSQDVTNAEVYLNLKQKFESKESEVSNLISEVNRYRSEIETVMKERSEALARIDFLNSEVKSLNHRVETAHTSSTEFEAKVAFANKRIETETNSWFKANSKVTTLKNDVGLSVNEAEKLFEEIEHLLI